MEFSEYSRMILTDKTEELEINLSRFYTVHHKLRMGWSRNEPNSPPGQAGTNRVSHGTADCYLT